MCVRERVVFVCMCLVCAPRSKLIQQISQTQTGTDRGDDPELHEIQRNTQTQTLAGTDTDQSDPERGTQTKQKKYG